MLYIYIYKELLQEMDGLTKGSMNQFMKLSTNKKEKAKK